MPGSLSVPKVLHQRVTSLGIASIPVGCGEKIDKHLRQILSTTRRIQNWANPESTIVDGEAANESSLGVVEKHNARTSDHAHTKRRYTTKKTGTLTSIRRTGGEKTKKKNIPRSHRKKYTFRSRSLRWLWHG